MTQTIRMKNPLVIKYLFKIVYLINKNFVFYIGWLTKICVNLMPFNFYSDKNSSESEMHSESNQSIEKYDFNVNFSKKNSALLNSKRPIKLDEKVRQEILDLDSWNSLKRERNFKANKQISVSTLSNDTNRSDVLNQTLNLIRSSSLNMSYSPDSNISLTRSDEINLKKAISEINNSQRLSDVSTVNGSFSFKMDENKEITTVYRSHS